MHIPSSIPHAASAPVPGSGQSSLVVHAGAQMHHGPPSSSSSSGPQDPHAPYGEGICEVSLEPEASALLSELATSVLLLLLVSPLLVVASVVVAVSAVDELDVSLAPAPLLLASADVLVELPPLGPPSEGAGPQARAPAASKTEARARRTGWTGMSPGIAEAAGCSRPA